MSVRFNLSTNENPLGMSPVAFERAQAALTQSHMYTDVEQFVGQMADHFGLEPSQVVVGNGSNEVLDFVARAFLAPGKVAVVSEGSFAAYRDITRLSGAEMRVVPLRGNQQSPEAITKNVMPDTSVVWFANPNNPTGEFTNPKRVKAMLEQLDEDVVVVLDEAYADFVDPEDRVDTLRWLHDHPNLIIVRTFSKLYGLAGIRIGFGLANSKVAQQLEAFRQPYNITNVGAAAILGAIEDESFAAQTRLFSMQQRQVLTNELTRLGFECLGSVCNFVTFTGSNPNACLQHLKSRGIVIRDLSSFGMPGFLRVSVGSEEANLAFIEAMSELKQV